MSSAAELRKQIGATLKAIVAADQDLQDKPEVTLAGKFGEFYANFYSKDYPEQRSILKTKELEDFLDRFSHHNYPPFPDCIKTIRDNTASLNDTNYKHNIAKILAHLMKLRDALNNLRLSQNPALHQLEDDYLLTELVDANCGTQTTLHQLLNLQPAKMQELVPLVKELYAEEAKEIIKKAQERAVSKKNIATQIQGLLQERVGAKQFTHYSQDKTGDETPSEIIILLGHILQNPDDYKDLTSITLELQSITSDSTANDTVEMIIVFLKNFAQITDFTINLPEKQKNLEHNKTALETIQRQVEKNRLLAEQTTSNLEAAVNSASASTPAPHQAQQPVPPPPAATTSAPRIPSPRPEASVVVQPASLTIAAVASSASKSPATTDRKEKGRVPEVKVENATALKTDPKKGKEKTEAEEISDEIYKIYKRNYKPRGVYTTEHGHKTVVRKQETIQKIYEFVKEKTTTDVYLYDKELWAKSISLFNQCNKTWVTENVANKAQAVKRAKEIAEEIIDRICGRNGHEGLNKKLSGLSLAIAFGEDEYKLADGAKEILKNYIEVKRFEKHHESDANKKLELGNKYIQFVSSSIDLAKRKHEESTKSRCCCNPFAFFSGKHSDVIKFYQDIKGFQLPSFDEAAPAQSPALKQN